MRCAAKHQFSGILSPKRMFTEDYVLRQIRMATAVLAHIIGLKKAGQFEAAQAEIDHMLEVIFGLRVALLKRLDDQSWLETLTQRERLDTERLLIAADLLKEEGDLLKLQNRAQDSYESSLRALNFYLEAALDKDSLPEPQLCVKVVELRRRLGSQELPDDTLYALFDFSELCEDYSQAESILEKLAQIPGLREEALEEQRAFYERLLDKSPADLARAGVSPAQIKDRLATLLGNP
jgi:hypothetical protein